MPEPGSTFSRSLAAGGMSAAPSTPAVPDADAAARPRTAVRWNLGANLMAKIVSIGVSLFCIPIYIRILGIGAYGLIGVWMALESVINVLDFGLSPTITREMALCNADPERARDARDFVRSLEIGYWTFGMVIGAAVALLAPLIATHWVKSRQIGPAEIRATITIIGVLIGCRWPLSFYVGGLQGLERQVLLSWINCGASIAASLGSVLILVCVSPTLRAFFGWQIVSNLAFSAVLATAVWRCLPASRFRPRFRKQLVVRSWRFATATGGIGLTALLIGDLDKLVVSKRLPLETFGMYCVAWKMASCLGLFSVPTFGALFPAFSRLTASGDQAALARLYHRGCQLMALAVIPVAFLVIVFAQDLLAAWTRDPILAERIFRSAQLLTAGMALNCLMTIPYALQLGKGCTSIVLTANIMIIAVSVPALILLTGRYGTTGAAAVWLAINAVYIVAVLPLAHRRLMPGELRRWYVEDAALPLIGAVGAGFCAQVLVPRGANLETIAPPLLMAWGLMAAAGAVLTPITRQWMAGWIQRLALVMG